MSNEQESINIAGIVIHKSDNGLYSLKDLWVANGKRKSKQASSYLKLKHTKDYILALEKYLKKSNVNSENNALDSDDIVGAVNNQQVIRVVNGNNGGTYGCKLLAYSYAMWLSPEFNIAVVEAFDAIATAKTTEELINLKAQVDLFNSNAESMARREPSDKQSLPVILGIPSNKSQPYFDYLVSIGELTKKLIPQLPKAEYFATDDSRHVLGKKGKTVLFDNEVVDLIPQQHSIFQA